MSESVAPAMPEGAVKVLVTTADGRVFDLGRPDSRMFKIRRRVYLRQRRKEIPKGSSAFGQKGKG